LIAATLATALHVWQPDVHPLWVAACADLAATLVLFVCSYALNNSSVYDPYWSVAPPLLGLYWALAQPGRGPPARWIALLALVGVWAVRLTWNCLRRWGGLDDEDWRYRAYRARFPRAYWWVSLAGLHVMPTVVVYLGCLSLYAALAGARPPNALDALALLVTGGAIWLEARADRELWRFRRSNPAPGARLRTGLWKLSRHPNYLGEITFWWGLFLYALAADPGAWWAVVGPLAITALFAAISIPMMERHMRAGRSP
jgi:steroid 5-alpha reductase family enzyme